MDGDLVRQTAERDRDLGEAREEGDSGAPSSTISAGVKFASISRRPVSSSAPASSWNASTARSAAL
jgi:hypothetical protein